MTLECNTQVTRVFKTLDKQVCGLMGIHIYTLNVARLIRNRGRRRNSTGENEFSGIRKLDEGKLHKTRPEFPRKMLPLVRSTWYSDEREHFVRIRAGCEIIKHNTCVRWVYASVCKCLKALQWVFEISISTAAVPVPRRVVHELCASVEHEEVASLRFSVGPHSSSYTSIILIL